MIDFDLNKMLFTVPAEQHSREELLCVLKEHPEVKFISLVGIDLGGGKIVTALDNGNYQDASDMQIEMNKQVEKMTELYATYKKNLF